MLFHGIGDWSLASHHGGPGSNPRDLWWTEWYLDRFFAEYFSFILSVITQSVLMFMFIYHQCYVILGIDIVTK
jgi:hypothetical protein